MMRVGLIVYPTTFILAAENFSSGILPNGSSAEFVSKFAEASSKQNGMKTIPSGRPGSRRAASVIEPRLVEMCKGVPA